MLQYKNEPLTIQSVARETGTSKGRNPPVHLARSPISSNAASRWDCHGLRSPDRSAWPTTSPPPGRRTDTIESERIRPDVRPFGQPNPPGPARPPARSGAHRTADPRPRALGWPGAGRSGAAGPERQDQSRQILGRQVRGRHVRGCQVRCRHVRGARLGPGVPCRCRAPGGFGGARKPDRSAPPGSARSAHHSRD